MNSYVLNNEIETVEIFKY